MNKRWVARQGIPLAACAVAVLVCSACDDIFGTDRPLRAKAITSGSFQTCAITDDDRLRCWGPEHWEWDGHDPAVGDEAKRTVLGSGLRWRSVSVGGAHVCGIDVSGGLYCWGENNDGRLGTGDYTDRDGPTLISGGSYDDVLAGGGHSCAYSDTTVECWGNSFVGQVGIGDAGGALEPTPVGLAGATAMDASGGTTCAIDAARTVYCWGVTRHRFENGAWSYEMNRTPVPMYGDLEATGIAVSGAHVCLLVETVVYCWGADIEGRLGGSALDQYPPVPVPLPHVRQISAGGAHTCALDIAGGVWCWGGGVYGQLGRGAFGDSVEPKKVEGLGVVTQIDLGGLHSCALTSQGEVFCWGANASGEIGTSDEQHVPRPRRMDLAEAYVY